MNSRDQILGRIRTALRDIPAASAVPAVRIAIPEVSATERESQFFSALEKLNMKTYRAKSEADARTYADQLIAGRSAVASNSPVLARCGIATLAGVACGFTAATDLRAMCASASLGITSADYALADTGTLVMLSSQEEARMISLLPPAHLAIVPRDRLLTGLDELLSVLPTPARRSSSMVFITGPSRTADIEQILVRGVHGPGEVHVVLL